MLQIGGDGMKDPEFNAADRAYIETLREKASLEFEKGLRAADKVGCEVIHDIWRKHDIEFKGQEALNFLIDALCHAGLVRPVEVRDDEWDDVSDIVYELGIAARTGGGNQREVIESILRALGLQPPKDKSDA